LVTSRVSQSIAMVVISLQCGPDSGLIGASNCLAH
jgi:hypothetical protein